MTTLQTDMTTVQAALEAEMATLGVEKFRSAQSDARAGDRASDIGSGRAALNTFLAPVTAELDAFANADRGKGRPPEAAVLLRSLPLELAAYLGAKVLLNRVHKTPRLSTLAAQIGAAVELEARVEAFAKTMPGYVAAMDWAMAADSNHMERRAAVLRHALSTNGDAWEAWGARRRVLVGLKIIEAIATTSGAFEVRQERRGKKTDAVLHSTPRFRDWLASLDQRMELLSPEFMPCVIPPKDWPGLRGGGYHTEAFAYPPMLVKTRNREHRKALEEADLSTTLRAVNAIQRTPWRVEKRVLAVAQALVDMGSSRAGLPSMVDDLLPTRPVDIDTNDEALRLWKRTAAEVYGKNRTSMSRRLLALKTLHLAERFSEYPAIWFPYQLDFRGRVYSIPQILQPQAGDLAKGLLVFAEGAPVYDPQAVIWFAVHGANSFGVDKVSFEDRTRWVLDNADMILSCAERPLDDLRWADADSPFVFLAWCFEYADMLRDPDGFRSHLPIAMDGSCNGLQHYSAMLRDPVAGAAVNLVPSDAPQDIYGEVAKVAMRRLADEWQTAAEEGGPAAVYGPRWHSFGIDRKITKRPVMVLPYGGTANSCSAYVREAVYEKLGEGKPNPFGDDLAPAIGHLSSVVWSSIGDVVVSARLAMGFLRQCARIVTTSAQSLNWTTPSGFPVVQAYPELTKKRLKTRLFGQQFKPQIFEEVEGTLDRHRQVNGIAPNFVHSLDAAALVLSVNAAIDAGITRFAMIHDSYGTSAQDTTVFASLLRKSFVDMYERHSPLDEFKDSVSAALSEKEKERIVSPPFVGGLKLRDVLKSRYFFA